MVSLEQSAFDPLPPRDEQLSSLLLRIGGREQAAFKELYTVTSARLYGIALALTRDREAAAEALQDAMLQVWRNAGRYVEGKGSPDAWLAGIVRYRALDMLAGRRRSTGLALDDQIDLVDETALSRLESSAEGNALYRCMMRLEQAQRHGIILSYVHGFSHSEIARRLEVPLGTIKSWMRRGLLSLKTCLGA